MENKDIVKCLRDSQNKMMEIMSELRYALRCAPEHVQNRAMGYWVAQIETALSNNHEWLGGCMTSLSDTIRELGGTEEECISCGELSYNVSYDNDDGPLCKDCY